MGRLGVCAAALLVAAMAMLCSPHSAEVWGMYEDDSKWGAEPESASGADGEVDELPAPDWAPAVAGASHPYGKYCGSDNGSITIRAAAFFSGEGVDERDLVPSAEDGLSFSIIIEALLLKVKCNNIRYSMRGDVLNIPELSEPDSCVGSVAQEYGLDVKLVYDEDRNVVNVKTNMGDVQMERC